MLSVVVRYFFFHVSVLNGFFEMICLKGVVLFFLFNVSAEFSITFVVLSAVRHRCLIFLDNLGIDLIVVLYIFLFAVWW